MGVWSKELDYTKVNFVANLESVGGFRDVCGGCGVSVSGNAPIQVEEPVSSVNEKNDISNVDSHTVYWLSVCLI